MAETTSSPFLSLENPLQADLPVRFRILNQKFEEKIYLENKPATAVLELSNIANNDLFLTPFDPETIPGPDNYHFRLQFRPGILKTDPRFLAQNLLVKKGWSLTITQEELENIPGETSAVLYFLNRDNSTLEQHSKDPNDDKKILLPLKNLQLDCEEGTQLTQVELSCKNLTVDDNYQTAVQVFTLHYNLVIINHRGNPYMPLHVGFTDVDTILNDGISSNNLTLRITNLQKKTPENPGTFTFSHRKHSKMYLYFVTDTNLEDSDYALGTASNVSEIELDIRIPDQENECYLVHEPLFQGDTPIWEIFPEDGDVTLQPHLSVPSRSDSFDISLSAIISGFMNGITHLYLRFENIPGYWDHTYTIPMHKQPLVIKGKNVGIGTTSPKAALTIRSFNTEANSIAASLTTGASGADMDFELDVAKGDIGNIVKGVIAQLGLNYKHEGVDLLNAMIRFHRGAGGAGGFMSFTTNNNVERMRIDGNGNVGIGTGTADPVSALEVRGKITATDYALTAPGYNGPVPIGLIAMWSGASNAIPTGWALCNGANGTPNLMDRFIVGAGSAYPVGTRGGEATHQLTTAELPWHQHEAITNGASMYILDSGNHSHNSPNIGLDYSPSDGDGGSSLFYSSNDASNGSTSWATSGATHSHANADFRGYTGGGYGVNGWAHENRPPYYALCYIMKI